MQLSSTEKALYVKIVYYGPGVSGKTTNLETLHRLTDPHRKQPMVSLKTEQDRTLFFDLLPFELGKLYGLSIRLKLFTVPGQIQYDTTRKQVLAGADGVVFVADSDPTRRAENLRMIRYLKNNLLANGLDPAVIPLVFQWNKRDLPATISTIEMEQQLNWRKVPAIESVATVGTGVVETFREIVTLTLDHLALKGRPDPRSKASLRERVSAILEPFIPKPKSSRRTLEEDERRTIGHVHHQAARVHASEGPERHREVLGLNDLLTEAVQANLSMSEKLARATVSEEQVLARLKRERKAFSRMLQIAHISTDAAGLYKIALSTLAAGLDLERGSALAATGRGLPLKELAVVGHAVDPLNAIHNPGIGSVASGLMDRGEIFVTHDPCGELLFGQPAAGIEDVRSLLALPLQLEGAGAGLLLLYSGRKGRDLDQNDIEFAELICSILRLALRATAVARSR